MKKAEVLVPIVVIVGGIFLCIGLTVALQVLNPPHKEEFTTEQHETVEPAEQQVAEVKLPESPVVIPDEKVSGSEKPAKNALEQAGTEQTETVSENTSDEQVEVVLEDTSNEQVETVSEDISTEQTETVSEESSSTISEDTSGEQTEVSSSDNNQHEEIMDVGDPPGPIEPEMVMDIGEPPGPIEPEMVMDIGEPPGPIEPDIGPPIEIPDIGPAIWIDEDGNTVTASSEGEIIITRPLVEETVDEKN